MSESSEDHSAWRRFYLARAKLQASSKTSALLSGFVMVSMVEVQLEKDAVPEALMVVFAVCTSLVVAVHLIALLISVCILPHIDAVASSRKTSALEDSSPHVRLHCFIEMAWIFSTGLGILLFLTQMMLLAWVRFNAISKAAAIAMTLIILPVIILFIAFSLIFYKRLVAFRYEQKGAELHELEKGFMQLEDGEISSRENV